MGDGTFTLGEREVEARDGVVRTADGTLAGSALTMIAAVRHVHALGVPLAEALTAASATPAALIGRDDLGRLAPGARADVVVLSDELDVVRACKRRRRRACSRASGAPPARTRSEPVPPSGGVTPRGGSG